MQYHTKRGVTPLCAPCCVSFSLAWRYPLLILHTPSLRGDRICSCDGRSFYSLVSQFVVPPVLCCVAFYGGAARVVQLVAHSVHIRRVANSNPARVTSCFFFWKGRSLHMPMNTAFARLSVHLIRPHLSGCCACG